MRILLVEDDELLGDGIAAGLKQRNNVVDWVKDGLSAEQALEVENFDIVVLDLGLPRKDGIEVVSSIRKKQNATPVLILTARDSTDDKIKGLDAGADDYMVKPFDLDELEARIRALHRRNSGSASTTIKRGNLELDPASHTATLDGNSLNIPRREFALLQKLLENQGRVVSRDSLLQSLYGWDDEVDSNTLEVHIHNLRKKLGSKTIRTIRGVGYMIEKVPESTEPNTSNEQPKSE
jgi:two-component system response regulator QseB